MTPHMRSTDDSKIPHQEGLISTWAGRTTILTCRVRALVCLVTMKLLRLTMKDKTELITNAGTNPAHVGGKISVLKQAYLSASHNLQRRNLHTKRQP